MSATTFYILCSTWVGRLDVYLCACVCWRERFKVDAKRGVVAPTTHSSRKPVYVLYFFVLTLLVALAREKAYRYVQIGNITQVTRIQGDLGMSSMEWITILAYLSECKMGHTGILGKVQGASLD